MDRLRSIATRAAVWAARLRASPPMAPTPRVAFDHRGQHERGQGLAEYSLMLALIALVAIGALTVFGQDVRDIFLDPIVSEIQRVAEDTTS